MVHRSSFRLLRAYRKRNDELVVLFVGLEFPGKGCVCLGFEGEWQMCDFSGADEAGVEGAGEGGVGGALDDGAAVGEEGEGVGWAFEAEE